MCGFCPFLWNSKRFIIFFNDLNPFNFKLVINCSFIFSNREQKRCKKSNLGTIRLKKKKMLQIIFMNHFWTISWTLVLSIGQQYIQFLLKVSRITGENSKFATRVNSEQKKLLLRKSNCQWNIVLLFFLWENGRI